MKDRKIGLFAGGIEVYWKDLGMKELPVRLEKDVRRLIDALSDEFEVVYPGLVGSKVKVTLEVEAELPDGAPEHVVRTVTENSRTLRFTSHGFEEE